MKKLAILLLFIPFIAFAQQGAEFCIDSLPTEGVLLNQQWKWCVGDNPDFAKPDFNDSTWTHIDPTKDIMDLPQIPKNGQISWFRLTLSLDSSINYPLALMIEQVGASEIFLNGKLIQRFGIVNENPKQIKGFEPLSKPFAFPVMNNDRHQILSIRYALQPNITYTSIYGKQNLGFKAQLISTDNGIELFQRRTINDSRFTSQDTGVFGVLGILFFTLFLFFPTRKVNLYFAIYCAFHSFVYYSFFTQKSLNDTESYFLSLNFNLLIQTISHLFMLLAVYTILEHKKGFLFWFLVVFGLIYMPSGFYLYGINWLIMGFAFTNLINIDITRVAFIALKNNIKGAWIIAIGGIVFIVGWAMFTMQFLHIFDYRGPIPFFEIAVLSIPISFAIYLAYSFGHTNRILQQKLEEVERLSSEKQQMLATQNETLEKQVAERTDALNLSLTELKETQVQLIEKEKIASSAAVQLKELDAVKTRLYTNITHEFRTPLTVILGMAQRAMDKPQEHLQEGLRMITRNGQNLLNLVNQMLDLNKLESGKLDLQYQQVDVVNFLKYIVESLHSLAENKDITMHFLTDLDTLTMDIEENRLQQVVSNLLSNAVKFTPKGGNIYMTVGRQKDALSLKVKDTGVGISEEQLPYIFDRFYQADTSATRHGEGTGIGLSLTYELVKLMGGAIAVKSQLQKGSEFEVTLPITHLYDIKETNEYGLQMTEHNAVAAIKTPLIFENRSTDNEKPLILIADDNADVQAYIASCLAADYHLLIAKDGRECEEMAFDKTPDLIISDVMMPFKDGFEVCKTLKSDERTSHIPIILLTAKADMESKLQGFERGADAYLMKPFNKEELLLRIKKLLELRQQLQQFYLSTAGLKTGPKIVFEEGRGGTIEKNTPYINSFDNIFVIKVKTTIEAHISDTDFDIEKLARALALSVSQVNRKLTALTGFSTNNFMRYVRLIKSKELLLHSGYSISAIAYDSGFNDPAYFIRVFKQAFGVTPQAWRAQQIE